MRITPADLTGVAPPRAGYVLSAGLEPMGGHPHFWQRAFSRRAVIQSAAGAAVLLGADLSLPVMAEAHPKVVAPKPIPETLFGNTPFHILFPSSAEPSAITDFDGLLGATEIQGEVTGGQVFDADMRFMKGKYIGVDGKVHHHAFGFIWLDVFPDTVGVNQTHDFNPGIHPFPSGLFWTIPISSSQVEIDLEDGTATFRGDEQRVKDFGDINNSLANGAGDPAIVSYTVRWHTILDKDQVENEEFHVEGLFLQTKASIEWSGTNLTTGKTFTAEQDDQKVIAAQLAHERNGVFFD